MSDSTELAKAVPIGLYEFWLDTNVKVIPALAKHNTLSTFKPNAYNQLDESFSF